MKDFIFKNALGLAALYIVLSVISYTFGVDFTISTWWAVVQSILPLTLLVFFVVQYKKLNGGFLIFKNTFKVCFGILVAATFISTFFNILLFNFIDPDYAQALSQASIEKSYEMMERMNVDEAVLDETITALEEADNYSISNLAKGFFYGIPFYVILSLIISAFVKKNPPQNID